MEPLDRVLDVLVAEGTLSADQAQAVRERVVAEAPRRRPRAAEAIGYLGGTLAAVSAIVLVAQFWADLPTAAQVALLVLTGLALWGAGRWAAGDRGSPGDRLAGALWFLSAAAMAGAAGVAVDTTRDLDTARPLLAAGAAAVAWGLPLWRARVGALQQLPVFGGILAVALAGLDEVIRRWPDLQREGLAFSLVVWAIGIAWALLAWGTIVRPRRTGYVLGAVATLSGAQLLAFEVEGAGLALAAVTATTLLAAAIPTAEPVLLGLGTAGVAAFLPQILDAAFPNALGGPTLTFITGVVLLAGALVTLRAAQRGRGLGR